MDTLYVNRLSQTRRDEREQHNITNSLEILQREKKILEFLIDTGP